MTAQNQGTSLLEVKLHSKKYPELMVCLDNGHASTTGGKKSPWTLFKVEPAIPFYEYEFNRKVTARLKDELEARGITVVMVCPEVSTDTTLTARATRANNAYSKAKKEGKVKKAIFVSVHANACGNGKEWKPTAKGWSVWTTKGQNNSDKLATCLFEAAEEILPKYGMKTRKDMSDGDPDYEENFTVIKKANMPAVLTENLFYTCPEETEFLNSEEGLNAIVQIHLKGIIKFAETFYKM